MSSISYDGMGAVVATFYAGEGVENGQAVKLTGSGAVGPCGDGEVFCGVALKPRAGMAAVQVKGFVQVAGDGLEVGWASLVGDGKGGVRTAGSGEGVKALVVSTEPDGSAVICL